MFERNRCWGCHDLGHRRRGKDNLFSTSDPIYNLVPPTGTAAEFGYIVAGNTPIFLQSSLRSGSDYGLTIKVPRTSVRLW